MSEAMAEAVRTAHVRIEGLVQGVGYRAWTQRAAVDLGLAGWVRNRRDGSVEAVFQGTEADVMAMMERCKAGPSEGRVRHVQVLGESAATFTGFEIRATA